MTQTLLFDVAYATQPLKKFLYEITAYAVILNAYKTHH